jgi:hypothetical protein
MKKIEDWVYENIIKNLFEIILIILLLLAVIGIFNKCTSEENIRCLGGHYELRYNVSLKMPINTYVCDSAIIIYNN